MLLASVIPRPHSLLFYINMLLNFRLESLTIHCRGSRSVQNHVAISQIYYWLAVTLEAACIGRYGKNWLLNPETSSQSEGYSGKWLIWLVCGEPLLTPASTCACTYSYSFTHTKIISLSLHSQVQSSSPITIKLPAPPSIKSSRLSKSSTSSSSSRRHQQHAARGSGITVSSLSVPSTGVALGKYCFSPRMRMIFHVHVHNIYMTLY